MKVGKPYWSIKIRNDDLLGSLPSKEYHKLRKEKQAEAAKLLGNQFDFATEKQATAAVKKLPEQFKDWVQVRELTPISLGLGWC